MKLNDEELNIILDGLEDTKIRIGKEEVKESHDYFQKVMILKRRIERELKIRLRTHFKKKNGEIDFPFIKKKYKEVEKKKEEKQK